VNETVVSNLELPTALARTPAGTFLIASKRGLIQEWDPATPGALRTLIDLSPTGLDRVQSDGDRGILGLAADPDFDDVGRAGYRRIYASYQSRQPPADAVDFPDLQPATGCALFDCPTEGHLIGVSVPLDSAATSYDLIASNWCSESAFHGMGDLEWSGDGRYLYVSAGDGVESRDDASLWSRPGNPCSDPLGFGGSWKSQHFFAGVPERGDEGAVVRFEIDELRSTGSALAIPEILGAGLRNPWRLARIVQQAPGITSRA
jgi:glucose/arabinose dehydrogenase